MISTDINANAGVGKMSESTLNQLQKLQDKVRALEQQNAQLRLNHSGSPPEPHRGGSESPPSSRRGSESPPTPKRSSEVAQGTQEDCDRRNSLSGLDEITLIDLESLEGESTNWLISDIQANPSCADPDLAVEWLRTDLDNSVEMIKPKQSLVNRLDDLAKRSPIHSYYSPNTSGSSRGSGLGSPHYMYLASTPARAPQRGLESRSNFDPRTFSRGTRGVASHTYLAEGVASYTYLAEGVASNTYLAEGVASHTYLAEESHQLTFSREDGHRRTFTKEDGYQRTTSRDNGYHRLAFGSSPLNRTLDLDRIEKPLLNRTFDAGDGSPDRTSGHSGAALAAVRLNATFSNNLNSTFQKEGRGNSTYHTEDQRNSTFETRREYAPDRVAGGGSGLNKTFESGNNRTFDKEERYHRKMSEDRLSSASSSNHLSRGSSNDGLLEDMEVLSADMDRLSTTSGLSESSVSHRLNDVQDVQDVARMQEESLRHPASYQARSATMSPSSEASLCSPQGEDGGGYHAPGEEGGGYQSEESCGSEGGGGGGGKVGGRAEPRRGEGRVNPAYRVQYQQYTSNNQQYSSQDSLPDSPYSSQSLDSPYTQDIRRSMPNLNKLRGRGAGGGGLLRPQYGLSQPRHHTSETRLQPPSRIQEPGRVSTSNLRIATVSAAAPPATAGRLEGPATEPRFAKPAEPARKVSGIARPSVGGIPRPGTSRLPAPGSRSLIARGGSAVGVNRRTGSVGPTSRIGSGGRAGPEGWREDCY